MTRVLVTGVGGGVGQGVIKSLRRTAGEPVHIVAADMDPQAAGLYGADVGVLVPPATEDEYVDAVVGVCSRHGVDVYVPGTDVELAVAAAHAGVIEERCGTVVLVASSEVVALGADKAATSAWLAEHGFPFAATWESDEIDPDRAHYPLIVKPRRGSRSIGVGRVESPEALRDALADRVDDPIVQACIAGPDDEYTCTVAVMGEEVSPVLPLRRALRSGDTHRAVPVHDENIEDLVRAVALTIGLQGPCNVQLRLDGDRPVVFEINPRFSGTTPFCAALGFNPVEWCLTRLAGSTYRPAIRWDAAVLRAWGEVIVPSDQVKAMGEDRELAARGVQWLDLRPDR